MVIKLVRTDATEVCKIQLSVGDYLIGRGKLLGCDDMRISRNHGQLKVFDGCISISALHPNPCFYSKKSLKDVCVLKKDSTVTLFNGDRFGLLPDTFWFEVIYCSTIDITPLSGNLSETNTEEYPLEVTNDGDNMHDEDNGTCSKSCSRDINDDKSTDCNESPEPIKSPTAPEEIQSNIPEENVTRDLNLTEEINSDKQEAEQEGEPNSKNDQKTPVKRSLSPEHDEPKKIKTEPVQVKAEPAEVKTEREDVKPSSSIDPAQQNAGNSNNQNVPKAPPRERCMYGANCYRKNPVHLSQFSHPRDSDWGDGAQVPCPYGVACAKRDPRHHRDHTHPPGHTPPPPHPPGVQVVQRHGNVYYINAHSVNFYEDHMQVVDSDGDSVDYDYEF